METPLHPDAEPLGFLLGTWSGEGRGEFPTIASFEFGEEIRFWHVGKPFLAYTQRTWHLAEARPLHAEMGYWRPKPGGVLEVVLSHPTGLAEIQEGRFDASSIELASTIIARSSTAKDVTRLERSFSVSGDELRYEVRMAAVGVPLRRHLTATLRRAP